MLAKLPDDVLLDVVHRVSIRDLLALRRTCRALHAFGGGDYVWHRIIAQLAVPVALPWNTRPTALSGDELQRLAIKAIQLDRNWNRDHTEVRKVSALIDDTRGEYVDQMQFLPGGKWLWTAQRTLKRGSWHTRMTLWSLQDAENFYRVWSTEISGIYRGCTVLPSADGQSATLVVGVCDHREVIEVHSVSLRNVANVQYGIFPAFPTQPPAKAKQLQIVPHPRAPHLRPIIHEISAHGDLLIVTIFALDTGGGAGSLQILFLNPETGARKWVDPVFAQHFSFLSVRVWGDYLFLIGEVNDDFAVRVYRIPEPFATPNRTPSPPLSQPVDPEVDVYNYTSLGPMLAQFVGPAQMAVPGHHIAQVSPATSSPTLSAVMFYHSVHPHSAQILHFSFDVTPEEVALTALFAKNFPIGSESCAQLAQIGAQGNRGVWLEHNWETQLNRVMKLAYDPVSGEAKVGMLLPPDPQLPFSPNTCHSLAFDEVSGRLCLGLYDGQLYLLDFV